VVGSIVLNQHGSLLAIAARQLLQESQVRGSIEDRILAIVKPGLVNSIAPKDLDTFTLAGNRDLRRSPDSTPGGIQGGILTDAGFITENQRPVAALGFFLRLG
jgi:hypothetical protein